jgi:hypothetical protein
MSWGLAITRCGRWPRCPRISAPPWRDGVLEDRDYGELARSLRCSESVVRQRVSRGSRALRRAIKEPT